VFMDQPITPGRVEVVIDLLRSLPGKSAPVSSIKRMLQPEGLPGLTDRSDQARWAITACKDLHLVRETDGDATLLIKSGERRSSQALLLEALDVHVLGGKDVERWFAMFYAFLIARGPGEAQAGPGKASEEWDRRFNSEVLGNAEVDNRFNSAKYTGYRRWLRYMGLGWHDSQDFFQPNPMDRLTRALPRIFDEHAVLESDDFMSRLAEECPELDGGAVFRDVNRDFDLGRRECTTAVAAALVEMNGEGKILLECPLDSHGWSLRRVTPARTAAMPSDRFDRVRLVDKLSTRIQA
jgi:hypothetical protein